MVAAVAASNRSSTTVGFAVPLPTLAHPGIAIGAAIDVARRALVDATLAGRGGSGAVVPLVGRGARRRVVLGEACGQRVGEAAVVAPGGGARRRGAQRRS